MHCFLSIALGIGRPAALSKEGMLLLFLFFECLVSLSFFFFLFFFGGGIFHIIHNNSLYICKCGHNIYHVYLPMHIHTWRYGFRPKINNSRHNPPTSTVFLCSCASLIIWEASFVHSTHTHTHTHTYTHTQTHTYTHTVHARK
jgi:hypothetical protein